MHLDVCKSCGGELDRVGNYYVCRFCGNKWMIDAAEDVHVVDRANAWAALRDCDFEKAAELFENIIFKDRDSHEAYWGRALALYGIIYVTDFHENRRVPTCNNISEGSFVESRDVRKAIELAPADIAESYRRQAENIEAIRAEWVRKASKEPPYDVFICFKDSDRDRGLDRTDDSYEAQNLYHALEKEGYRVFFSRESLRGKVSEHYEPYIYNALKTAKVMVVYGQRVEYFSAVWVKNEWIRFRNMIERGEKSENSLVVAYKGIDPADLPTGLRSRQCMNAAEFTFLEDLKAHIASVVRASKKGAGGKWSKAPEKTNPKHKAPTADTAEFFDKPKSGKAKWIALISAIVAMAIIFGIVAPNLLGGIEETTTAISSQATEVTVVTETAETESTESESTESESTESESMEIESMETESTEKVTSAEMPDVVPPADNETDRVVDTDPETTEAPECDHVEKEIPAVAPTCEETGLTAGKKCSVCDEILVAQNTVAAIGHKWDDGKVTTEPDCDNAGVKTFTCQNDATHTKTEVVPAAHTLTAVAGKAASCTEDGIVAHSNCSVCNKNFDAEGNELDTVVIPAAHTPEPVAGKAATCTEDGLTDGVKCSVCEEFITAQTVIPATNHANKTKKAYIAPTTAEAGWYAHTVCPDCGKVWDAEGEELDAVPTIPVIVPTTNAYLGVAELKDRVVSGALVDGNPSKFNPAEVSADRTYVRFSRAGESQDGNVMLLEGNTTVTGKFLVLKYRTNTSTGGEFWANTVSNGHSGGKAHFFMSFVNDSEWHIMIVDLSKTIPNYVQADGEGNYTIQWSQIDLLNSKGYSGYFDIAYVAYCDDLSKVAPIMQEGDNALCPHYVTANPVYTKENDTQHSTVCIVCGEKSYGNHYAANDVVWSSEDKCYTATCVCGADFVSDMIYKTEAYSETNASSAANFIVATKEDGFIRYTAATDPVYLNGSRDPYLYFYRNGTAVTGKFMVIKYRMDNNGNNAKIDAPYAGSANCGETGATGNNGDYQNYIFSSEFIADGEWHYLVVTPKEANASFIPNDDGTYSWGFFRLKVQFAAYDGSCYVDVAEIAFADNQEAAEYYAYKNETQPPLGYTYDDANNQIDGVNFLGGNKIGDGCLTFDMSGKTLTTTKSLVLGGWVCTPGGVDHYYIRVTKIDGVAVENPELVSWQEGMVRADISLNFGARKGFAETCANGAGFVKKVVDLTAYAGKTIDFELIAITNYGATVTFGNFLNVAVPTMK